MDGDGNTGSKRDGRKAFSIPESPALAREFLARPRPAPTLAELHPGPWYVRRQGIVGDRRDAVFIVLDMHNKCVCECDDQRVADAIARSWEVIR